MFAFSVNEAGNLMLHVRDERAAYAVDINGNPDYSKPLFALSEDGYLLYRMYDGDEIVNIINLGKVKGERGDKGDKGDAGDATDADQLKELIAEDETIKALVMSVNSQGSHLGILEIDVSDIKARLPYMHSQLEGHIADTNNPHGVTAAQINTYTKSEIDDKLSNVGSGTGDVTQEMLESALSGYVAQKDFVASNIKLEQVWGANLDEFSKNINGFLGQLPSPNYIAVKDDIVVKPVVVSYNNLYISLDKEAANKLMIYSLNSSQPNATINFTTPVPGIGDEYQYKAVQGEFIIQVDTDDAAIMIDGDHIWVGDEPDLSILGWHHIAFKIIDSGSRNRLYLNEYLVEEA